MNTSTFLIGLVGCVVFGVPFLLTKIETSALSNLSEDCSLDALSERHESPSSLPSNN